MGHLNAGVQRVRLRVRLGLVVALGGLIALAATVLPAAAAGARTHAMRPGATVSRERSSRRPPPPRLPRNFRGRGRWIVRDLGITVPFTWRGRNGNSQMVAGGPRYRIWFTNLIYHDTLYTLTYRWPGVSQHPCSQIPGRFSLRLLNQSLATARFVGREILLGRPHRRVNHFRVGFVFPQHPPGNFLRFPLALGDIYVDQRNRGTFWQVLQFGLQNLYDPALDEWLVMDTFQHRPGRVRLPRRCAPPPR